MPKAKLLSDEFYGKQFERLSGLTGFPMVPAAQTDLKRALRRITDTDANFLHRLITRFVDGPGGRCPTPAELVQSAGQSREKGHKPLGSPSCMACNGTGWVSFRKMVSVAGAEPYEAEFARRCACAPPAAGERQ
jgi:hypothetical protein